MNLLCLLFILIGWVTAYSQAHQTEKLSHKNHTREVGDKKKNVLSPYLRSGMEDAFASMENELNTQQTQLNTQLNAVRSKLHTMQQSLLGRGGVRAEKRVLDDDANSRVELFEEKMDEIKTGAEDGGKTAKDRIDEPTHPGSTEEKEEKKKQVDRNVEKVQEGAELSKTKYRELEESASTKPSTKTKLIAFSDKLGADSKFPAAILGIGTLINAEKSWQSRTEAGLEIVSAVVSLLPSPVGEIGSTIFGLVAACFGAASPTTNEYTKLRNQILSGVQDMFDTYQKAEAMGCVYKIEFLKGILEVHDAESMTDKEFYAIILLGGIDIGVTTLGTFKYNMNDYRDRNTIDAGRRALEMAHFYVQVAEARDMLHSQILTYIKFAGEKAGITSKFFENTQKMAKKDYKNLFWWEETCCDKDDNYFGALLAYNLPLKKHAGEGKAVDQVYAFIKRHHTEEYYTDAYNSINDDVKLSYENKIPGSTSTEESKYVMAERPPPVNGEFNSYYPVAYRNWDFGLRERAFEIRSTNTLTHNIACDIGPNKYVWDFGISETTSKKTPIKFTPTAGERLVGTVTLQYGGSNYYLTRTKKLDTAKDKYIYTADNNHDVIKESLTEKMKLVQSSGLAAISEQGKQYPRGESVSWSDEVPRAKIRMFSAKLKEGTRWGTAPLYLLSPAAEYSDGEDKLYLVTSNSENGVLQELGAKVGTSGLTQKLTAATLRNDPWNLLWFRNHKDG